MSNFEPLGFVFKKTKTMILEEKVDVLTQMVDVLTANLLKMLDYIADRFESVNMRIDGLNMRLNNTQSSIRNVEITPLVPTLRISVSPPMTKTYPSAETIELAAVSACGKGVVVKSVHDCKDILYIYF